MQRFLGFLLICLPLLAQAGVDPARLVQMVDYIGVDYAGAVAGDGRILSQGEYTEMRDFAAAVAGQITAMEGGDGLQEQAVALQRMIAERRAPTQVAAAAAELRGILLARFDLVIPPRRAPDMQAAQQLFSTHCAACHGTEGRGDGPLAAGMEPAPTDFHDHGRYTQRTLYGLYTTLSLGVADTAMSGYADTLSESQRWALAFHVGSLAVRDTAVAATAWTGADADHPLRDLRTFITTTPAEARARWDETGAQLMAAGRSQPARLFADRTPVEYTRQQIGASLQAYRDGKSDLAYQTAVDAYLEGFELVEQGLDAVAPDLRLEIEAAMTAYREMLRGEAAPDRVQAQAATVRELLGQAAAALSQTTLSNRAAFGGAFVILAREGLEALLVVAALAAFLVKTGRRRALPYLHLGWAGALVLGVLTWWLSRSLIQISGASREMTEGVAALTAMAVLFYVGFWLHDKTHARQWQRFIRGSVEKALSRGTLWGLTGLAFLAVYREVFETILFYQAMWVQTDAGGQAYMLGGFGGAALLLLVLGWLILRYSVRLPLRQFFAVSGALMFVLAIVFAGKGVAALQEAGILPVNPVNFPRIDLLGVYPNLESLLLQTLLLLVAGGLMFASHRQRDAAAG